jgi:hypothetical protein
MYASIVTYALLRVVGFLQAYDLSVYPDAPMDLDVLVDAWRGTLKMSLLPQLPQQKRCHVV